MKLTRYPFYFHQARTRCGGMNYEVSVPMGDNRGNIQALSPMVYEKGIDRNVNYPVIATIGSLVAAT